MRARGEPDLLRRWVRPGAAGERRHGAYGDAADGLEAELFAVPGKVPLYLEGDEVRTDLEGEQTVGVHLRATATTCSICPAAPR